MAGNFFLIWSLSVKILSIQGKDHMWRWRPGHKMERKASLPAILHFLFNLPDPKRLSNYICKIVLLRVQRSTRRSRKITLTEILASRKAMFHLSDCQAFCRAISDFSFSYMNQKMRRYDSFQKNFKKEHHISLLTRRMKIFGGGRENVPKEVENFNSMSGKWFARALEVSLRIAVFKKIGRIFVKRTAKTVPLSSAGLTKPDFPPFLY